MSPLDSPLDSPGSPPFYPTTSSPPDVEISSLDIESVLNSHESLALEFITAPSAFPVPPLRDASRRQSKTVATTSWEEFMEEELDEFKNTSSNANDVKSIFPSAPSKKKVSPFPSPSSLSATKRRQQRPPPLSASATSLSPSTSTISIPRPLSTILSSPRSAGFPVAPYPLFPLPPTPVIPVISYENQVEKATEKRSSVISRTSIFSTSRRSSAGEEMGNSPGATSSGGTQNTFRWSSESAKTTSSNGTSDSKQSPLKVVTLEGAEITDGAMQEEDGMTIMNVTLPLRTRSTTSTTAVPTAAGARNSTASIGKVARPGYNTRNQSSTSSLKILHSASSTSIVSLASSPSFNFKSYSADDDDKESILKEDVNWSHFLDGLYGSIGSEGTFEERLSLDQFALGLGRPPIESVILVNEPILTEEEEEKLKEGEIIDGKAALKRRKSFFSLKGLRRTSANKDQRLPPVPRLPTIKLSPLP
jgi:hypothetical protein